MRKNTKIKEAITKDKELEDAKKTQDDFYAEFDDQDDEVPLFIDLDTLVQ